VDEQQLLVLIVPAQMKDDMVDALIANPDISGFTLSSAAGYSREHSHFNLREQVEGYRSFCRLEVLHRPGQRAELFTALAGVCGGEALRYWVSPVVEQGHLGGERPGESGA